MSGPNLAETKQSMHRPGLFVGSGSLICLLLGRLCRHRGNSEVNRRNKKEKTVSLSKACPNYCCFTEYNIE